MRKMKNGRNWMAALNKEEAAEVKKITSTIVETMAAARKKLVELRKRRHVLQNRATARVKHGSKPSKRTRKSGRPRKARKVAKAIKAVKGS